VVARGGSEDHAATAPDRRARRTDASAPGALLAPGLLTAARDFGAGLDLVRTLALLRHLVAHHRVEEMLLHVSAEDGVVERDLGDLLSVDVVDVDGRHRGSPVR